jgi:O-antigen/teichoic acid export membrane protein
MSRRIYPELDVSLSNTSAAHFRTIFSFSFALSAIHVLGMFIYYSDALIIGLLLPVTAVTYFVIASSLADYGAKVSGAISRMVTPRVSAMHSIGDTRLAEDLSVSLRVASLATAGMAVVFFLRGASFIELWMGKDYREVSGQVLSILSVVVWFAGFRGVAISAVIGANAHRSLIPWLAMEAVINVAMSALLVPKLGVTGAAIGTCIPNVLVTLAFIPRCLHRATGSNLARLYIDGWLRPSVACIPFAGVQLFLEVAAPASSLSVFLFQSLASGLLLIGGGALIASTSNERAALLAWAVRMFRVSDR